MHTSADILKQLDLDALSLTVIFQSDMVLVNSIPLLQDDL